MPLGLNRDGVFRNGSPITLPHEFGDVINWTPDPAHFGNLITLPKDFGNLVTWPTPDPTHFGNIIGGETPPGGLLRVQVDLTADQIAQAINGFSPDFGPVIIPAPGPGLYINVTALRLQYSFALPAWNVSAQMVLSPFAVIQNFGAAEVTPSMEVQGLLDQGSGQISTWLMQPTLVEIGACQPYNFQYFENQPYIWTSGGEGSLTIKGGGSLRIIAYYTIEAV